MSTLSHSQTGRIDVRACTPVKQLLQEAARARHKNVSEFLPGAGVNAANQTAQRFEIFAWCKIDFGPTQTSQCFFLAEI